MMSDFVVLFLSDTHFGYPNHDLKSKAIINSLYTDIGDFYHDGFTPNLIVFGGDLGFGELANNSLYTQYQMGKEWINKIYSILCSSMDKIPFIFVPGNHDMDRISRDVAHDTWIEGINSKDLIYKQMYDQSTTWKNIIKRQQAWSEFAQEIYRDQKGIKFYPELNLSILQLTHDQKRIGVVGFNSSWASYKDKQDSNLWVGQFQFEQAMTNIADCDFKIAVSHHPTNCLNDLERNWIYEKIEMNFQAHFHGHIHDQWFTDSHRHLKIAAGSCYQGAEKENAYSWLVFNFNEKKCDIYLRKFEEKGEGGWIPFYIPGKTNSEGIGTAQHIFASNDKGETLQDNAIPKNGKNVITKKTSTRFSDLESIEEYIHTLQDLFSFRWEPVNFAQSSCPVTVYWPIRLRQPTPIHAVQCFAASGLQKLGAKIVLYLDDFGNIESSKDEFCSTINKWMNKVGANYSNIDVNLCSDTILSSDDVWTSLQNWFTNAQVDMEEVLQVSKLIKGEEFGCVDFQELAKRKPRRLLTPAIVWACLVSLYNKKPGSRFLTLGGYDESKLWMAWRRRVNNIHNVSFGHLYIPELFTPNSSSSEALRMSGGNLKLDWDAEDDIRAVFNKEIDNNQLLGLSSTNRIIPWCLSGCYLLPSFIAGVNSTLYMDSFNISTVDELRQVENINEIINPLARSIAHWLL